MDPHRFLSSIYQTERRKEYENLQITTKIGLLQYILYRTEHVKLHTLIHITTTSLTYKYCMPRNLKLHVHNHTMFHTITNIAIEK